LVHLAAGPCSARAATSIAAAPALRAEQAAAAPAALPPGTPVSCWSVLSHAHPLLRRYQVLQRLRRVLWPSCCNSAAYQLGGSPTCKPPFGGCRIG
jgi:hypothetical protein